MFVSRLGNGCICWEEGGWDRPVIKSLLSCVSNDQHGRVKPLQAETGKYASLRLSTLKPISGPNKSVLNLTPTFTLRLS